MITILTELHLDTGLESEELLSIWLVSYRKQSPQKRLAWAGFVDALNDFCVSQGWQLSWDEEDSVHEAQLSFQYEDIDNDGNSRP